MVEPFRLYLGCVLDIFADAGSGSELISFGCALSLVQLQPVWGRHGGLCKCVRSVEGYQEAQIRLTHCFHDHFATVNESQKDLQKSGLDRLYK